MNTGELRLKQLAALLVGTCREYSLSEEELFLLAKKLGDYIDGLLESKGEAGNG